MNTIDRLDRSGRRRVVITGIGLVTPVGVGTDSTWEALLAGTSGIGPITRFDSTPFATKIAGEVRDFDATPWMSKREARAADRFIQFAMAAGAMAVEDSKLEIQGDFADRVGVYVGSGIGGLGTIEETHSDLAAKGPRQAISPFFVVQNIINLAAGQLSIRYGARGPNMSHVSACSTGAHAIGEAYRAILAGDVDAVIAGGSDAAITPLGLGGFSAMRALSTRNDAPTHASRPFDRDRDGFVLAEGAGILVLEELTHAIDRGAQVYAELCGYGANADAHHVAAPSPGGTGAQKCMRRALADARMEPSDITYINAHGTSTKANDAIETSAIKEVFGEHAKHLMVSSTKSMTGHMMGATGVVEAGICALAVARGAVPPTINLESPDPECDLDYVPRTARHVPVKAALSNSFGFGGTNACLIFAECA